MGLVIIVKGPGITRACPVPYWLIALIKPLALPGVWVGHWVPMNPVYRILAFLGVVIGFAVGWFVFGVGFAEWWRGINECGGAN